MQCRQGTWRQVEVKKFILRRQLQESPGLMAVRSPPPEDVLQLWLLEGPSSSHVCTLCLWQDAQCPVTAALIVWWNEPRLIYCKQHWWNRFADIATFGSRSIGDKIDEIMQYIQTIYKCLCFFYSYFHCLTGCLWTDTSLFSFLEDKQPVLKKKMTWWHRIRSRGYSIKRFGLRPKRDSCVLRMLPLIFSPSTLSIKLWISVVHPRTWPWKAPEALQWADLLPLHNASYA